MTRSPSITWTVPSAHQHDRTLPVVAVCVRYATGVRPPGWIIT